MRGARVELEGLGDDHGRQRQTGLGAGGPLRRIRALPGWIAPVHEVRVPVIVTTVA
ncbi:hypothetical protein GCM10010272_49560 [Streptomyces lateritius]|nr:hypothetical protein GCM10010272_49560 [Streptomyces lateritius]